MTYVLLILFLLAAALSAVLAKRYRQLKTKLDNLHTQTKAHNEGAHASFVANLTKNNADAVYYPIPLEQIRTSETQAYSRPSQSTSGPDNSVAGWRDFPERQNQTIEVGNDSLNRPQGPNRRSGGGNRSERPSTQQPRTNTEPSASRPVGRPIGNL